ncbi:vacuolar fusion protein MON1 [Microthyrium microscopicum]|uniref:Vacuolar fusion protein MON1 n=1 Tax=Microthyrium microscopicum TaxID=703497 RepID=A0A6A6TTT1_9PEZI|nr:vacuolar fusion protein MON1 [Microthyrium microscopicum]
MMQPSMQEPSDLDESPPPLPPRPKKLPPVGSISGIGLPTRATTAVSVTDFQTPAQGNAIRNSNTGSESIAPANELDESMSVRSTVVTVEPAMDAESLLGEVLEKDTLAWRTLGPMPAEEDIEIFPSDAEFDDNFDREFDELDDMTSDGLNEQAVVDQWKSKLKQYFILSRAGKPVWSRHGNDQLVTSYIGVILTLISFYEDVSDSLRGFTSGSTRFVVLTKGQLYLVATSSLGESDQQLRGQLEALYMQILSTLTLPVMERMFKVRASTDLRRPLQGTEKLLSALADGFTRGSPSTLLNALECLKMRKSHRQLINNAFLKTKSDQLLYGLIVAGGRLVSVVRPRKHSLHPGDLHLIFNMLYEAGGIKAGEGENWIPLCLPGFNNTGYVYMYVSFLSLDPAAEQARQRLAPMENLEEVAVILISATKESFFDMQQMKTDLVEHMSKNGSYNILKNCVKRRRLSCSDIVPGSPLKHFLYKSKTNVQFAMPSFDPLFADEISKRRLLTLYSQLQASIHSRPAPPKVHHTSSSTYTALAWNTQLFELYAIAPANTSRIELSQAANKVVQYIRREEERVFIIGGAVF